MDHAFAQVPENKTNGDGSTDAGDGSTDAAGPSSLEASSSSPDDGDALSRSEGLPEGPTQCSADLDSFSDSFTNTTPSSTEPAASVLSTETLGRVDLTQEDERLSHEGVHHLNAEGLQPDQCQATAGGDNQAGKNCPELSRAQCLRVLHHARKSGVELINYLVRSKSGTRFIHMGNFKVCRGIWIIPTQQILCKLTWFVFSERVKLCHALNVPALSWLQTPL